jgi:hypothetical protein
MVTHALVIGDDVFPERVEDSVHIYEPQPGSSRNLLIRNKDNGQRLEVQRGDVLEMADSLEEMAANLRKAYGITSRKQ